MPGLTTADLKFPHYENEIAQSEGATGERFANLWMHNGYVQVDDEKMAKSLGNFLTIREILERDDRPQRMGEIIRFMMLTSHYRSPLNYADGALDNARSGLTRLYLALSKLPPASAAVLTPKSCVPHRRRRPVTPPGLSEQIRQLRRQYPNLGKAKLHVLLRDWCAQRRLALPSVSTIGRIIAKDPHKMRHAPARISPTGRLKPLLRTRKTRKPKHCRPPPLALFACDTVMRLRDGIRRHLFTFIDPTSRFAIAFAANSATSRNTTIALEALTDLLPVQPQFLLSDNGSEFMGDFHQRLNQLGIVHWWTYPRSPKMNAHCERFNRTIQEQFVDYHADLLFTDLALFNRKMAAWLVEYNTVIPHHSLGLQTPIQFGFQQLPQCQRYWTHTFP